MSESIAARVDPDTAAELEAEAERRDASVSSVVGDVLDDWAATDHDGLDADDKPPAPTVRSSDDKPPAHSHPAIHEEIDELRQHVETLRRIQNTIQQDARGVSLAYWVESGVYGQKKPLSEIDEKNSVLG